MMIVDVAETGKRYQMAKTVVYGADFAQRVYAGISGWLIFRANRFLERYMSETMLSMLRFRMLLCSVVALVTGRHNDNNNHKQRTSFLC